ncbi:MAG: hypothetical protein ACFCUE_11650 [Candidatus Bathyarchaeia archaeon]
MYNHVKVEVKPIHSFVRYFAVPFLAVFALAFAIISVPMAGQFSLATSVMFSLGYAWCFSAPLLLTGTRNLRHQQLQTMKTSNGKKAAVAVSAVTITGFSVWAIQSVMSQVNGVATAYLSIVSVFFVGIFAVFFYFSKKP